MLRSVNGPETTIIDGLGTVRCVYLTSYAALAGFTLTNGAATRYSWSVYGGGAYCESTNACLTNCVIVGNSASGWWNAVGGGVYRGTLYTAP